MNISFRRGAPSGSPVSPGKESARLEAPAAGANIASGMKRDDYKFVSSLVAVAVLMALLVFGLHERRSAPGGAATVDVERIEKLAEEGVISLHEADHWEAAGEAAP